MQISSHSLHQHGEVSKTSSQKTESLSAYELSKKTKDLGVLKAHLSQSSEAADNSQKLLLKTAITEINEHLAPYLGENAAEKAYESDLDFSPKATAKRIVDGSTAFFASFKENNPDLDEEQALEKFNDIINGGIEKGFADARGILESLKVLEGKVDEDINSTYDFVQQGLVNFREKLLTDLQTANEESSVNESSEVGD
ncbi:DUF5610 domain-containing protein [Thalassotalea sp. M1531]|uniref:DUF5610 domain-containing protein n=1 Tax=Thalassotalea algicola TaxID=2716224 RepID=A0A7Y0L983_9GAMM|nr:DUF5610 domain-containing protein [Thalassotalea algicola]NMP30112.1 DUF5610 domain-containing protein [Thalassotalea algicola]